MKSERLRKIVAENTKLEKESPYNFCDRWCERCPHERQARCALYLEDIEHQLKEYDPTQPPRRRKDKPESGQLEFFKV